MICSDYNTKKLLLIFQKVLEKSAPSHNYQQHSYSHQSRQPKGFVPVLKSSSYASNERSTVGKPLSSAVIQQQISSSSHHSSNDISSPPTVTASGFEKAPMIQLNYVVKSSDNESINTYGPSNITVMRRTSSKFGPYANKWYENDNNKNAKPLAVEYF